MTKFEQFLIGQGYVKFVFNCKTKKFDLAEGHVISTMVNLNHWYFHESMPIESQIPRFIGHEKQAICFGLNEAGKPPTLISPRPRIEVKKLVNGKQIVENELSDDSMNVALSQLPAKEVYRALLDRNIILKFDLTE